jgi:hypothetical protein
MIEPVTTAALIVGGASLIGSGVSLWANSSAQSAALKEHRRAERLRVKFAKEESEREERRFSRTHALQKQGQNFNMIQSILNGTKSMFESNRANTHQIMSFNRSRQ